MNELNSGNHCGKEAGIDTPKKTAEELNFDEFSPANYDEWKEAAIGALKGAAFEKSMHTPTYEGITLEPLYTAEHTENLKSHKAFPGEGNLTRGADASGYIAKTWEIAQPADSLLPADTNRQLRNELEKGGSSIAFLLDSLTIRGIDANAADKADGQRGVSLSTLEDLELLLENIEPSQYPFHIYTGVSSVPLLGLLAAYAEKHEIPLSSFHGCIGAGPLGFWLQNGNISCDTDQLFDEMAHSIHWAEKHMPSMRTILIKSDAVHNSGGSAVQEIGNVMAAAVETLRALRVRQIDVDTFASRLRFEFSLSSNFFMEIAKIRAVREVWSQIAEAFGGSESSKRAEIFGRTSFFTKTFYDPYVNMLRNTTEAFSAVIGGVNGLTVGCFDEAARPGNEFSRRVARNTQVLLREEFSLLQPVDPSGGSWYLESLTDTLARKAWEWFQKIEISGGFSSCIKSGMLQASIEETLTQRFKKLASRSDRAVGTNMYANTQETPLTHDGSDLDELHQKRRKAVQAFLASRDEIAVLKALEAITASCWEGGELLYAVAAAAKAGATLGEVRGFLNGGNEEPLKVTPLGIHRWTEQYEALRQRTEKFKAETGDNVKIFLANMGPIPQHKARADFITGFMEVANFEVLKNNGYSTIEECAEAAVSSEADVAVICSTDDTYPELVPLLASVIKAKIPAMTVFLAGAPKEEFKQSYLDAGVDDFISVRSNCLATLADIQKTKGMF